MTPAYLAPISHWAQIINGEIIWDIYQNFNKQTLRNRTFIHSSNGVLKLTIPIKHSKKKFILKNALIEMVQGFSLETVLKKFKIENIELMKMDCKGCEFFLNKPALDKIRRIKIEFAGFHPEKTVEDVLLKLKNNGFSYVIYRSSNSRNHSNKEVGYIYAEKGNTINAKK